MFETISIGADLPLHEDDDDAEEDWFLPESCFKFADGVMGRDSVCFTSIPHSSFCCSVHVPVLLGSLLSVVATVSPSVDLPPVSKPTIFLRRNHTKPMISAKPGSDRNSKGRPLTIAKNCCLCGVSLVDLMAAPHRTQTQTAHLRPA